ncbi:cytochrome b5 [Dunaliella salina]|uniref:Cytochrome b5 n=1 Tax=Dunaliella salina TaxID=3046 RepID=A0ABQ7H831_DUNSA|nr:cytochrome b5 [Dunaliella salina]|eukprot:KAF5843014.1 cytochrome b5 [Dunaliella salina]
MFMRQWTLADVAAHNYVDDLWVVVDGRVYDITEHLVNHHGWGTAAVSTPLSILAAGGTDCSQEFHDIHRLYPIAYKQLAAFYIGDLDISEQT